MEKGTAPLLGSFVESAAPPKARTAAGRRLLIGLVVALLVWSTAMRYVGHSSNCRGQKTHLSKSPIEWKKCDAVIECGRLEVPLDYHDESAGKASLSVAKYPATSKDGKLGTLFLNPGGPGGSGVSFIYRIAHNISELVEGRYDIVSWDPRGINGTLPRVECFASQTEQDIFFARTAQEAGIAVGNMSKPEDLASFIAELQLEEARNEALVELCVNRTGEKALSHMGTSTVVRDLEFLSRTLEGDTPVNFWGFSYGTIVGSYFVNIFPDRVGRIIIDGVVDPVSWANDHPVTWAKSDYVDTESVLQGFVEKCSAVGPDRCSLAANTSSPSEISQRIDKLLADTYERPIPVPHAKRPGALTSGHLLNVMFRFMYIPRSWRAFADLLSAAVAGDGAPILDFVQNDIQLNTSIPAQTAMSSNAILCTDAAPYSERESKEGVQEIIDEVMAALNVAPHFGTLGPPDVCHMWPIREAEYFTGPFNSTLANKILIIGNTHDPITPLASAKIVHGLLKQSTLVQHNGYGHCSLAMISLCTARVIRNYLLNGTLPTAKEVFCEVDEPLFPTVGLESDVSLWTNLDGAGAFTDEDTRLLEIAQGLGTDFEPFAVMPATRGRRT